MSRRVEIRLKICSLETKVEEAINEFQKENGLQVLGFKVHPSSTTDESIVYAKVRIWSHG